MMMMMMLPKRKLCSIIHPLFPRLFSASAPASSTQNPDLKTPKFGVANYLVASFGFSPDKASRVSKSIAHLKSPEKPDAVCRFLKDRGFSEADIKRLITWRPDLLCSSPEKTLDPNLRGLRDMGLSTSALNQIILSSPTALVRRSAVTRVAFWMDFLGGDETALVKTFRRNSRLINHDISQTIVPKISLLQSHGFSNQQIRRMVYTISRFITSKESTMEDLLKRTKELGFQPGSGMFLQGLNAMSCVSRVQLQKKMNLLMSFGWSEDDFFSAIRKAPLVIAHKEENLRTKMDFLLREARCVPSYIASHSLILAFSLENRLRPRHHVLHLLETKGLCQKHRVLYNAICLCNSDFVERYILPHKEIVPEAYAVLCASGSGINIFELGDSV